jgi:hypothetical protein
LFMLILVITDFLSVVLPPPPITFLNCSYMLPEVLGGL